MKKVIIASVASFVFAVAGYAQPCVDAAKEVAPALSEETKLDYVKKLEEARKIVFATPNGGDADMTIWYGRRTAYTGRYKDAIAIFTQAIKRWPQEARLYRHRGHRYITLRCFDDAIRDFETAAKLIKGKPDEIEPDGLPNAQNIPTSTLQSNIWYHLGLAYYLKGDFKRAAKTYEECMKVSKNNDMLAATTHWYYMTLRRLEKNPQAARLLEAIDGDFEVIENDDYLRLLRLYRGEVRDEMLLEAIGDKADSLGNASLGYGVGNWYLYNRDSVRAEQIFRRITAGNQWASFGYIASEAELARAK
jgi:tetratricopeptide (TPR) repeat protein